MAGWIGAVISKVLGEASKGANYIAQEQAAKQTQRGPSQYLGGNSVDDLMAAIQAADEEEDQILQSLRGPFGPQRDGYDPTLAYLNQLMGR